MHFLALPSFTESHFAPAFFFLPAERRRALNSLYAVFRVLDDAVDNNEQSDPKTYLKAWEDVFTMKSTEPVQSYGQGRLATDILDTLQKYDIPTFSLLDFIRLGVAQDLEKKRFETPMDTERYCYGVAGTVGIACLPVFGVPWAEAKEFATRLGIAVQWVNTVRDVGLDAEMGRIYLPQEHLQRFSIKEEDILSRRSSPAFVDLMRFEADVARSHYQRAEELMPAQWERQLLPARIMGTIYRKLLAKIEKRKYPVLTEKIRLNIFEKGAATLAALKN